MKIVSPYMVLMNKKDELLDFIITLFKCWSCKYMEYINNVSIINEPMNYTFLWRLLYDL
jgi:hypothetical protein